MYIVVGLGNPGKDYEDTRHNLGFKTIEELARQFGLFELKAKSKLQSYVGESVFQEHKIILAQPQTFMNHSGLAVSALINWYKASPEHLIVVFDDVDLEPGQIRIRPKGISGGHHGVDSIIEQINTTEFNRVRIGIGREDLSSDVTEYVLKKIPPNEREILNAAIPKAAEAVKTIISCGIEQAMNKYNA